MDNMNYGSGNDKENNEDNFQIPEAKPKKSLKKKIIVLTSGLAAAALVTVAVFGANGNLFSKSNTSGTSNSITVSATSGDSSSDTAEVSESELFTKRDLKQTYDSSEAETITLSDSGSSSSSSSVTIDGSTITITEAGIYVVSGTITNGQIVVDCEDTDAKAQIVLDNATISNSSSACIYGKSADKIFVTTEKGTTNCLSVTGEFVQTDDNNVDGVIFSKCDLTVNGEGTLNITDDYGHGIVSKDDLRVTGSTLNIDVAKKGLQGKDSVRIDGGTINITADTEGIEGALVYILDGDINIDAKDDGINASDHSTSSDDFSGMGGNSSSSSSSDKSDSFGIYITGGNVTITSDGDGIDSNGFLNVSGGTIYVNGPTSDADGALDYEGEAVITGGTVIAAGSSGMAVNFGDNSTQGTILYNFSSTVSGEVTLTDSDGNVIASYTPTKEYQSVVISSPDITNSGTYTISAGGESEEITMTSYVYGSGNEMGFGGGKMGGGPGSRDQSDSSADDSNDSSGRPTPPEMSDSSDRPTPPDMSDSSDGAGGRPNGKMGRPSNDSSNSSGDSSGSQDSPSDANGN